MAAHDVEARHLVVNGRRWRRTDPSIPEPLRVELVRELMAARRVQDRSRTQDAKVALGERGRPWWEDAPPSGDHERLEATVRALLSARGAGKSICPSDVARAAGGSHWRSLVPVAREVARDLARRGQVRLTQGDRQLDPDGRWKGPIRIRLPQG